MAGQSKYKDTLNLPQTELPMRGDLAKREPQILAMWAEMDIYARLGEARANAPRYVLHDGPPYANGHLHYGHILNKILKDIVVKYKTMAGFRAPFVPGWDTHGLPIELAVERELAAQPSAAQNHVASKAEIRRACRDYALRWVDVQRTEFQRLGVFGDWAKPYLTLAPSYERAIVRALATFARGGYLYRGKKPVYWCPTDRTALAEAEIEYKEKSSPSIYVRCPLVGFDAATLDARLAGARVALPIWTTTPWTLPANLAIVLHPDMAYVAVPSPRDPGERLLVVRELAAAFLQAIGAPPEAASDEAAWIELDKTRLRALEGARYQHPFIETPKADADFRVWFADYVTAEQGTGLVHTAPGHGADDYKTGIAHGLAPYAPIDDRGRYLPEVPHWAGLSTDEANPKIVAHLAATGTLLNQPGEKVRHQYAHCWRCKHPILYRATPQWFLAIDHAELRAKALAAIEATDWVPPWGEHRIHVMIAGRPDWCLSRQRVWGVPIPAFYCTACGVEHARAETMEHIAEIFGSEGADAWWNRSVAELVPPGTRCAGCGAGADKLEREQDIVDVWFESGTSWYAMQLADPEHAEIDLYLEGSDQHRGWFHSSLLVGVGVAGKAPYKTVLTHGFVVDENGNAYSKSDIEKNRALGKKTSYTPPEDVIAKHGTELFRLWVASTEFRNDIPYTQTLLDGLAEWYRKFRNTARYLLGNVGDFTPTAQPITSAIAAGRAGGDVDLAFTDLDRCMLARTEDVVHRIRAAYDAFELHVVHRLLVDFVTVDVSAIYADVAKDRLYTDAVGSPSRRAAQAVLYEVLRALTTLSAPILAFTAEDLWQHMPKRGGDPSSVHLVLAPAGTAQAPDAELAVLWNRLIEYRERVTAALEPFRAQKNKSLDARVTITPTAADRGLLAPRLAELADLFIVSEVSLTAADAAEPVVVVTAHGGLKCDRCWKWFATLSPEESDLCARCCQAVHALPRKG